MTQPLPKVVVCCLVDCILSTFKLTVEEAKSDVLQHHRIFSWNGVATVPFESIETFDGADGVLRCGSGTSGSPPTRRRTSGSPTSDTAPAEAQREGGFHRSDM